MKTTFCLIFAFIIAGCASLSLQPADFSWPIEVAAAPNANGVVQISRYQVSFNSKPLLFEELQDSINVTNRLMHVIRDQNGFYFITAKDFKNVYVFTQDEGALKLKNKIEISETGLEAPAFNQKGLLVQLVNEQKENEPAILLSTDGIQEGENK
ncbi:MAG: hypothetical protein JXA06_08750 [Bacteroidetes bacterium]|nr:hypothetical protein [Bacteroidota bacterium]